MILSNLRILSIHRATDLNLTLAVMNIETTIESNKLALVPQDLERVVKTLLKVRYHTT